MNKLTILLLAYNVEKYIEQCINSILAQKVTFTYQIYIGKALDSGAKTVKETTNTVIDKTKEFKDTITK